MSLNATFSLGTTYDQQEQEQEDYADDEVDLGGKVFQEGAAEGDYVDEFSQGDQVDYEAEMNDGLQGEVLDLQITEPLDGEFQVGPWRTCTPVQHVHTFRPHARLHNTCTPSDHMHTYTTRAHLQTTCTLTQQVHTFRPHTHVHNTYTPMHHMHTYTNPWTLSDHMHT